MKTHELPNQAQIKELLHYDPETGVFRWRNERANGKIKPWDVAGGESRGYLVIGIDYVLHFAHRLAWVYMTGKPPENQIDHLNGCKLDNCWVNLREATNKQNNENQKLRITNTSGFRGVTWVKRSGKWLAHVGHNKKFIHVGYFDTAEEAAKAAAAKRAELFTHDTGLDALKKYCEMKK